MPEPSAVLSAVLLDLSALDDGQPRPTSDCSDLLTLDAAAKPGRKAGQSASPPKDRRQTQRTQIQTLRAQAEDLSQQLLELTESQQLRDSLDRLLDAPINNAPNRKQVATRERHAKQSAERQRIELLCQVSANMNWLQRVTQQLQLQQARLPMRLPARCASSIPDEDDALVFRSLKASVEHRHDQLDSLLQLCVARIDTAEKREMCIHTDGRGADSLFFGVKPFDVLLIGDAMDKSIRHHPYLSGYGENEIYMKWNATAEDLGDAFLSGGNSVSDVRYRCVFRLIVLQRQVVVLWETVADWKTSHGTGESKEKRMRLKGWQVVRPFEELGDAVSLSQAGVSVNVFGSEASLLNPQAMSVMRSLELFGRMQSQRVDNLLLDSPEERGRDCVMMSTEEPCGDVLTAFLLGMSALDHVEDRSLFVCFDDTRAQDNPTTRRSPVRCRRSTQREQLQELRLQAGALSQQLQELNESQQLRHSLDRLLDVPNADLVSWKESATRERHAKEAAEEKKSELMRRISSNTSFLEYVRNLVIVQIKSLPTLYQPTRCMSFMPEGDDAQLFLLMKSGLDYQQSQLDAIFQQCVSRVDTVEKRETCIHADGRGVDVREFGVKPFGAITVGSTLHEYFEGRSHFRWQGENEVYLKGTVSAEEIGDACSDGNNRVPLNEIRNQSVMRRFVHQNQFVMLWQAVTDWDSDHHDAYKTRTTRLWQKGWLVIRPFDDLGSDASLAQSGMSIQIQVSDGSEVLVLDPKLINILQSLDALGKRHSQIVDNILMDTAVKCS